MTKPDKVLQGIRAALQADLEKQTAKAGKLLEEYNQAVGVLAETRRKIYSVDSTLAVMNGEVRTDTGEVEAVLIEALRSGPKSLRELQDTVLECGLPTSGVRKALAGVEFKMVGGGRTAKYGLREASYADLLTGKEGA